MLAIIGVGFKQNSLIYLRPQMCVSSLHFVLHFRNNNEGSSFSIFFFFKFLEICINNTDNEINNEDIAHYHSHKTTIVHLVH